MFHSSRNSQLGPLTSSCGSSARALRWWVALAVTGANLTPSAQAQAAGPTMAVGLRAGVSQRPYEKRRIYGLVEVDLGRLGESTFRLAATAEPAVEPQPSATAASSPRATRAPAGFTTLSPRLAQAALRAASRSSQSQALDRRIASMATRSRWAASLPDVKLRAGTSLDESLRLTPTLTDPARFTQTGETDLWLEANLTWRLGRAAFHEAEIRIENMREGARKARRQRRQQVLELLVEWQRQRDRRRSRWLTDEDREGAALAALAAQLRLDALTDGWFSRYLDQQDRQAQGAPPSTASASSPGDA